MCEYIFDPLKEARVDSELIGYAQKVTNFPTFSNSFNRAVGSLFGCKMFLKELLNTCWIVGVLRGGNKKQLEGYPIVVIKETIFGQNV